MNVRAVIVAGGGSNFGSMRRACQRIGIEAAISDDPIQIGAATHVILPGVGAAAHAMRALRESGLDLVLARLTQPLLGVCLGMQLLYEFSEEADRAEALPPETAGAVHAARPSSDLSSPTQAASPVRCLGLIPGTVRRLPAAPSWPHMGWNRLAFEQPASPLLKGIGTDDWFYFVHGYAAPVESHTIACSDHGEVFGAVVANANVYGAQFHPEKSASAGRRLLMNFFALT